MAKGEGSRRVKRTGCREEAFICHAQQHWELKMKEIMLSTHVELRKGDVEKRNKKEDKVER